MSDTTENALSRRGVSDRKKLDALRPFVLTREQAAAFTALSVTTMERLIRQKAFPPPRQLTNSG